MANYICYLILIGIQLPFFYKKDELGNWYLKNKAYLALCCVELIFLAGLRGYTVGADTATYLKAFNHFRGVPFWKIITEKYMSPRAFEWGYFYFTEMCRAMGMNETVYLCVIACLIYIPVFHAVSKYSDMPYLSLLCYFAFGLFSYSLGIFRQMIAISILLCGWKFVEERKLIQFLCLVALAMSFHTTALVALMLYILYGIKWKRIIWMLPGMEVGLLVFGRKIILLATKILPQYVEYLGGQYDVSGGSYKMLLLLNAILIASIMFRNRENTRDDMVICALVLAICVQAVGYSMGIFGRMVPYFSVYLLFAIPNAIHRVKKEFKPWCVLAAAVCLFVLVFMEFNGNDYVTPYYTIFDN